jgi:hypothetical protein
MSDDLGPHVLRTALKELRQLKTLGDKAMAQLSDQEFFTALDPESNSIAVIVKHLAGNMRSRWTNFLASDGEKADRHRDDEFVVGPQTTRAEVMRWWEDGWRVTFGAIEPLGPADLMRTVLIRHEPYTVVEAIARQLWHYGEHVGQIIFLAKHLRSGEWRTLSIPRGKSEEFNKMMRERGSR